MSCAFFSCTNASGGGSGNSDINNSQEPSNANASGGGITNPTPPAQTLSSARWSCTTSEEETAIGNKVSEVLCLFDENKFELRKNISYEDISFFQTFYKGTYEGSVIKGMTFNIEEELDIDDFDDEMKQVFNLESAAAKSARNAMSEARAVYPMNIAAILTACQEKLKNVSFKNAENKTMSLETNGSSIELTDADNNKKEVTEKASDGIINLDGFLLTGNPCNMRPNKDVDKDKWEWASTVEKGAQALKKTEDGKWTCQFRADNYDTLIRIIWNDWMADWGLSAIDKEKSTLPRGAGITDDTQAVNKDHPEWQDSRNIAITGLEAKRKYDITFDTKKSPGKICIEIAEHKISTLDGWLLTGTPDDWSGDAGKGALPLKKTVSNSWTVTFPAIEGWNGFKLCTQGWEDYIGWSGFDWEDAWKTYNGLRGSNVEQYALEDDDVIAFQQGDFDGTEKITLTFGINNGRVTCKTDIEYTKEYQVDGLYFAWTDKEKPVLIENKKVTFTAVDEKLTNINLLEKINENPPAGGSFDGSFYYYDGGACWYDGESYYFFRNFSRFDFENTKLPSGVSVDAGEYYMIIRGLTTGKQYTLTFDTTSAIGRFSLNIK